jgi:sterol desaturase/sphingolipid hydroxylase (fatty acid hydroxylase superfamily)
VARPRHPPFRQTWFSLARLQPLDRLGTALDSILPGGLGFPIWALAINVVVRQWYGYLLHADLPFAWRKLGRILNSPVAHRWHHARNVAGANFATVFSVFDRAFGTGPQNVRQSP